MYLMLYNLIFTSLPPLAIGVYDKRVPEDFLLRNCFLYKHVSTQAQNCKQSMLLFNFSVGSFGSCLQTA